jgi:hypothetical protein
MAMQYHHTWRFFVIGGRASGRLAPARIVFGDGRKRGKRQVESSTVDSLYGRESITQMLATITTGANGSFCACPSHVLAGAMDGWTLGDLILRNAHAEFGSDRFPRRGNICKRRDNNTACLPPSPVCPILRLQSRVCVQQVEYSTVP